MGQELIACYIIKRIIWNTKYILFIIGCLHDVNNDGEPVLGIFRPRQNVCSFKFLRLNFYPGCHLITAIYAQQNSWAQFLATDGACFVLHMCVRRSLMRKCEGCRCTYKCTHTSTLLRLFVLPPACQESAENSTNEASEETRALETWSKEASCRNEWKYNRHIML